MPFIVAEPCVKCKYTDCVMACPVDCFYEGPDFLVIHPDECVDCGACVPECPVEAIYEEEELPEEYHDWIEINAILAEHLPNIAEQKEPLPEADKFREVKDKAGLITIPPDLYDEVRHLLPQAGSAAEGADPQPEADESMRHAQAPNVSVPQEDPTQDAGEDTDGDTDQDTAGPDESDGPAAASSAPAAPSPQQKRQAVAAQTAGPTDPADGAAPTSPAGPQPDTASQRETPPHSSSTDGASDSGAGTSQDGDASTLRKVARQVIPGRVRGRIKRLLGRE